MLKGMTAGNYFMLEQRDQVRVGTFGLIRHELREFHVCIQGE
jgi:hypothetical protein